MTYYAITAQYPIFTDLDGTPLENGYIYIGTQGNNPITNPQTAYWDDTLLYPAGQPIRTLAGAPNRNGSPSPIFIATNFSILVQDKNGNQVYYSQDGIKNFTAPVSAGYNYIMNPNFEVLQRFTSADRWINDVSGYTLAETNVIFTYNQTDITGRPRYYRKLTASGGSALATEYARYVQVIEDVYKLSGQTVTLSFWAKVDAGLTQIATSFDQCSSYNPAVQVNQGIEPTIHSMTADWQQYSVTTTLPDLTGGGAEGILDARDTGTQVNFWLAAGSNFDTETNSLGHGAGELHITKIRLNLGSQIDESADNLYSEELLLCERYYEKSGRDLQIPSNDDDEGSLLRIAADTSGDLLGFTFRTRKRTNTPTITAYSPDADDQADLVYRIGTGQVAVSSYVWINDTGISIISLGAATVIGDYYQFHYAVDDEFIL